MPKDHNQNGALTEVGRLKGAQAGILASLRLLARARRAAGDEDGANRITLLAIKITRENLRIEAARRKALKAKSLGPVLGELQALVGEAEALERQIRDVATALAAATRFIELVRRALGVLS